MAKWHTLATHKHYREAKLYQDVLIAACRQWASAGWAAVISTHNNIYRVEITKPNDYVTVMHVKLDTKLDGTYDSVEDLPKWMREKLAVLSIMSSKPPTTLVEGVGQRISENVFWVYK